MFKKYSKVLGLFVGLLLAASDAGAALKVSLVTLEPGPTIFESFGHSALLVEDSKNPDIATAYDYVTVDVEAFWTSRDPMKNFYELFSQTMPTKGKKANFKVDQKSGISSYILTKLSQASTRKVIINELLLTEEQALELVARVDAEIYDTYQYHNYNANCATKLRDRLFDDGIFGADARKEAQSNELTSTSRETLFLTTLDEAAQLATAKKVKLAPDKYLTGKQTKMAIKMFGLPTTSYATSKEFYDAMVATEASLRQNTFLGAFVGQEKVDQLIAVFHEYFFSDEMKKTPLSEYEAMLLPKNLRSSSLSIINPATGKLVVSNAELRIERGADGEAVVHKVDAMEPSIYEFLNNYDMSDELL